LESHNLIFVVANSTFDIKYDKLVLAVGSKVDTYGIKGVTENCLFMKEAKGEKYVLFLDSCIDSSSVRNRVLDLFETANVPGKKEEVFSGNAL
jgi:NADH:ubiquinone reductase (non-electrogenic)